MKNKIIKFTVMTAMLLSISLMYSCDALYKLVDDTRDEYSSKDYTNDGTLTIDFVKSKFAQWINSSGYSNIKPQQTRFPIRTAQELMAIGDNIYTLAGFYYLVNDIDISGVENWKPIGNKEIAFTGKLYGNGKIIYGLKINRGDQAHEQGLFGRTYFAEIRDVGVGVVSLKAGSAIGAVVGSADVGSQIVNVAVAPLTDTAKVEGSGGYYWQGLPVLGEIPGADIFGSADHPRKHALVGGVVGHLHLDSYLQGYNLGLPISFSNAHPDVLLHYGGFIGGLVGSNYGTVEGVSTADVISSKHSVVGFMGGLIGYNAGSAMGVATGNVFSNGPVVGGFIGHNVGKAVGLATGDVSSTAPVLASIGGFIGNNSGTVTGASTGNVFAEHTIGAAGGFIGEGDTGSDNFKVSGYTLSNVVFVGTNHTKHNTMGPIVGKSRAALTTHDDLAYDSVYYFYHDEKNNGMFNSGHGMFNRGVEVSYNLFGVGVEHTGGAATISVDIDSKLRGLSEGIQIGVWTFWNEKWPMLNLPEHINSVLEVPIQDLVQEPETPGDFPDY